MSTIELKHLLIDRIRGIDDEDFLNALRVLTDAKVHRVPEGLKASIVQSQQDLAEGKVYDNDTVFDEVDQWLNEQ